MWVVICDGRKWLIFENAGSVVVPRLKLLDSREQENPPTRTQGSGPPPRTQESVGHARSALEQTNWHDEAERKFLGDLAQRLDASVRAKEFQSLLVAAPPRALGMLRSSYSGNVKAVLRTEIDKDLTKMPVHEIERILLA
jgi:protein required for attachment to host cells